ncbi:PhzF family phenazine biosynthesis protein [Anaerotignum sp. MB30-C6]|uniref:PhzF family phenazine biosynthesis protein n=1 Tax=Anaerotignum sp. MB30-C6 TaxID=3070814 RepID=UPI0027DDD661|nr:PhzF family phenazine biosynthesis protein [Anaerotignum sp. MB30-C6]WMI79911.1 PhzF family phenazine biosynthesis protein [Anaerotignum sp. MB30-C6]
MDYYIVDTFADSLFTGNPTGICILKSTLADEVMQKIAEENMYSETAFVEKVDDGYSLRFFTPVKEVPLCVHAVLGASYVIHHFLEANVSTILLESKGGSLKVLCEGNKYKIQTPIFSYTPFHEMEEIGDILGIQPTEGYLSRDLFFLLDSPKEVLAIKPDFERMKNLPHGLGVIVTAKGTDSDFVSRCFFPKLGVNEDMATGSSNCIIAPFWASRLNKKKLMVKQLSQRTGHMVCHVEGDHVILEGKAVLYLKGEIQVL